MDKALVWFRRDLRCTDHAALSQALQASRRVACAFVFDRAILDPIRRAGVVRDRRVDFIHQSACRLDRALRHAGGALRVAHGEAVGEIVRMADELGVDAVFANRDTEPYALERDRRAAQALSERGRRFLTFKDQVVFECDEVMTGAGRPFSVFTPYRTAWLKRLADADLAAHPTTLQPGRLESAPPGASIPSLQSLGFEPSGLAAIGIEPGEDGAHRALEDFALRVDRYAAARDFPGVRGPSYLSVHLRFGTVSVRAMARLARQRMQLADPAADLRGAQTWLSELVWREFYQMALYHHPHIVERAFDARFDRIVWRQDPERFLAWCEGRTGYPLVDAAMAQLNRTGYMHNRLRMVAASFLVKDLGIDWRLGERYFARQLNDFDLASNVGGWQWAASTGCDAQPWFRIFNPVTQSQKFDADGRFIRRYLPQLAGLDAREIHAPWTVDPARQRQAGCVIGHDYPAPIVDHALARQQTLERYAAVRRA
jgi:deoxyribodipyrimidine photo-lyase